MYLEIDEQSCADFGCQRCLAGSNCPTKALAKPDSGEPVVLYAANCNACAKCLPACPASAITLTTREVR